jgi:hypothetical protein
VGVMRALHESVLQRPLRKTPVTPRTGPPSAALRRNGCRIPTLGLGGRRRLDPRGAAHGPTWWASTIRHDDDRHERAQPPAVNALLSLPNHARSG